MGIDDIIIINRTPRQIMGRETTIYTDDLIDRPCTIVSAIPYHADLAEYLIPIDKLTAHSEHIRCVFDLAYTSGQEYTPLLSYFHTHLPHVALHT